MNAPHTQASEAPLDAGLRLVLPGRGTPAGEGWTWVAEGWKIFTRAPLMWIVVIILMFLGAAILSLIPVIGNVVFQIAQTVIAGGLVLVCRTLERGGEFELEQVFAGFTKRFVPLLIVAVLLIVGMFVLVLIFVAFVGMSFLTASVTGGAESMLSSAGPGVVMVLLATLVILALMVPLIAAYWFAPALVMMHDMKPVAAMKASFFACFRNFITFIVYGIVLFITLIIAMIPFGLGLLVWIPVAITSNYVAYRRIFTDDA